MHPNILPQILVCDMLCTPFNQGLISCYAHEDTILHPMGLNGNRNEEKWGDAWYQKLRVKSTLQHAK